MSPTTQYTRTHQPSYGAAAVAAAAVFVLYTATLAPSTAMWDTSEYIAASYVLGLPHPPGNPMFVLIGHLIGLLPLPLSYAARINVLAALSGATAAGLWFLVTERVLSEWLPRRWMRLAGGAAAVVVCATAFTVWNQSVVSEKVYPVSLLGFALVTWLTLRWSDRPDGRGADRRLLLIAYLIGLCYAVHPAGFLTLPAVSLCVVARRPRLLRRWRMLLALAGSLALGVTTFAYEPLRAGHFPALNEGEPTACARTFAWSCTLDGLTFERLRANMAREQYGKPSVLDRQAPFADQVAMWWLYFKWQWLRDAYGAHPGLQDILAVLFLALGLFGGYTQWRRHRPSFWYFGPFVFTLTLLLIYYLNFKYGYSQAPELGDSVPREVRDRDYFYVWTFSAWGVWVALGLCRLWEFAAAALAGTGGHRRTAAMPAEVPLTGWLYATPVLALALIPLIGNARQAPRAGQYFTREWAFDALNSVEPYGVLFTHGDNDTFPLWYAQEVEGVRKDVTVAVGSYLGTDWFVRQLIRRPVADYDSASGPSLYRGREWRRPSGPPLRMSFSEADSIPPYVEVPVPRVFRHGGISAPIAPGVLTRDQLVVLRIIRDSFPERPIYFTAREDATALGLSPYTLRQGLVHKLTPALATPGRDTVAVGGEVLDLPRSTALWDGVYRAPRALIREGEWVDRASISIPLLYLATGDLLARALAERGDRARARQLADTVERMVRAVHLAPASGGASGG